MPVLIQWAIDDGPVNLHHIWKVPIEETLELIEDMMNHEGGVCGFNLTFDHFQLCKIYTTLINYPDREALPEDIIDELAEYEEKYRGCVSLKPVSACDLMVHARKGHYQSMMDRKDIRIRKVPAPVSQDLCDYLEKKIQFDDIYFARSKDPHGRRWKVFPHKDREGEELEEFRDVVLKFKPSSALSIVE